VRRQDGQSAGLARARLGRHLIGNRQQHARLERYNHRRPVQALSPWTEHEERYS
jgi:hypothetical protein